MRARWWLWLWALGGCGAPVDKVDVGDEVGLVTPAVDPTDTDMPAVVDTDVAPTDSAVPAETADTAQVPTGDTGWSREIDVMLTVDDEWSMFFDGAPVTDPGSSGWSNVSRVVQDLPGRRHVVAVHGRDVARVISGFIAVVHVSGELYSLTGDGQWRMSTAPPPADWMDLDFDDSAWVAPSICPPAETGVWGGRPVDFANTGAQWIWNGSCRALGQAWFRLEIE